jgi:hypothetical protein
MPMTTPSNRISVEFSPDDLAAIRAAVQVLQERLLPKLVMLGPDGRRELAKMGDRTVAFAEDAEDGVTEDGVTRKMGSGLDLRKMAEDGVGRWEDGVRS